MKQVFLSLAVLFLGAFAANAADIYITGDITTSQTWVATNRYILGDPGPGNGPDFIKIKGNKTLTINAGTVILSERAALVVTQGSKLICKGTLASPVVFTSAKPAGNRAPGDWGGIVICGKAPINAPGGTALVEGGLTAPDGTYGGALPADNSGSLKYVRIEFAGIPFLPNNETNGLTLAGCGNKTVVQNVQVSFGGDDAFEFFGGTVNAKNLVSFANQDDDFDTDLGWTGRVQFGVIRRSAAFNDISGSNGFESDNDATGSNNTPYTQGVFSNITAFGPTQSGNANAGGNWRNGFQIRRNSRIDIRNSVFVGWPVGANVDNSGSCPVLDGPGGDPLSVILRNNVFAGNALLSPTSGTFCAGLAGYLTPACVEGNTVLTNAEDAKYVDPYNATNPNFKLQASSEAVSGASFADLTVGGTTGFTNTTYRGAFSTTADWTDTWTNWDPQNTAYFAAADDRRLGAPVQESAEVFPNPSVDGQFTVAFKAVDADFAIISVYDIAGRFVYNQKAPVTDGMNTVEVLSELNPGFYLVEVAAGAVKSTVRLEVQ